MTDRRKKRTIIYSREKGSKAHKNNWRRAVLCVFPLGLVIAGLFNVAAPEFASPSQAPRPKQKPVRVLFVGNSYTYFNNLPEMLERLSTSAGAGPRIEARMVVAGGATLERHWRLEQALLAIRIGDWDYVVLQEQSTLGPSPLVDGLPRIRSPDDFFKYARMFDEAVRQAGAQTVFYST